jgi:hypothetical protein
MSCMWRIEWSDRTVSGKRTARENTVKTRMASPKEPKETALSATIMLMSGVSRTVR